MSAHQKIKKYRHKIILADLKETRLSVITVQGSARQGCIVAPVLLFNNDDSNT
jgi:hypothetical protein